MSSSLSRPPWAAWLYTHNPFYAISVVLMLYGVRAGYGELEIGSINCWSGRTGTSATTRSRRPRLNSSGYRERALGEALALQPLPGDLSRVLVVASA